MSYIAGRLFAYYFGLKDPKFIAGFTAAEVDAALMRGELDGRSNNAASVLRRNPDWLDKNLMDFHAILEVPKGDRHDKLGHLPEIKASPRTTGRKNCSPCGASSPGRLALYVAAKHAQGAGGNSPGAMRKALRDPEFHKEFLKLVGDDAEPLMPEDLTKAIRDMPRDPEAIELLKQLSGAGPLPMR